MAVSAAKPTTSYEKELLHLVHNLPVERMAQIIDFARYIRTQADDEFLSLNDESEEDILADEAVWDAQFAATQEGLSRMAGRVRAEIQAGRTQKIKISKHGEMTPE